MKFTDVLFVFLIGYSVGLEYTSCHTLTCGTGNTTSECISISSSDGKVTVTPCSAGLQCQDNGQFTSTTGGWNSSNCTTATPQNSTTSLIRHSAAGYPCGSNSDCASNTCQNGICQGIPEGQNCTLDDECQPNHYCYVQTTNQTTSNNSTSNNSTSGNTSNSTNGTSTNTSTGGNTTNSTGSSNSTNQSSSNGTSTNSSTGNATNSTSGGVTPSNNTNSSTTSNTTTSNTTTTNTTTSNTTTPNTTTSNTTTSNTTTSNTTTSNTTTSNTTTSNTTASNTSGSTANNSGSNTSSNTNATSSNTTTSNASSGSNTSGNSSTGNTSNTSSGTNTSSGNSTSNTTTTNTSRRLQTVTSDLSSQGICMAANPVDTACSSDSQCQVGYGCNNLVCTKLFSVAVGAAASSSKFCVTNLARNGVCEGIVIVSQNKTLSSPYQCSIGSDCIYQYKTDGANFTTDHCQCDGTSTSVGYCGMVSGVIGVWDQVYPKLQYTVSNCSGTLTHTDDVQDLIACGSLSNDTQSYYNQAVQETSAWSLYQSGAIDKCASSLGLFAPNSTNVASSAFALVLSAVFLLFI